ncbi:putative F-box protein At1g67390 [Capsella rubella]|uniref:putative F-box protein At1g67390 n=1 Tax=Capsella rubella TaxID=81985 RepID=UPI000CD4B98A|nr:putative F-box protein At1g67390 [Capsella rubella]
MKASLSSDASEKRILIDADQISKFPDNVLVRILSTLATEDAIKTGVLKKRWQHLWKRVPYLHFDMLIDMLKEATLDEEAITKVLHSHNGQLKGCSINHYAQLCKDPNNVLKTWIQFLVHEKETKALSLSNCHGDGTRSNQLLLSPGLFSHPNFETLFLYRYGFKSAEAFNNCHNLRILKLETIYAEVDVFNQVLASCPSLKVLVLHDVMWLKYKSASLKIHNKMLKLLHVSSVYVDCIDVSAPLLDIFSSYCLPLDGESDVTEKSPKLLFDNRDMDFNRVNMHYNISNQAQETERIGHEFVVSKDAKYLQRIRTLAVFVNVTNLKQVKMLRQLLSACNGTLKVLHILFQLQEENLSKEEGETSTDGTQNKMWDEGKLFPNAEFRVESVSLVDFTAWNEAHFAIASRFITEGTVTKKMRIMTYVFGSSKQEVKPN